MLFIKKICHKEGDPVSAQCSGLAFTWIPMKALKLIFETKSGNKFHEFTNDVDIWIIADVKEKEEEESSDYSKKVNEEENEGKVLLTKIDFFEDECIDVSEWRGPFLKYIQDYHQPHNYNISGVEQVKIIKDVSLEIIIKN